MVPAIAYWVKRHSFSGGGDAGGACDDDLCNVYAKRLQPNDDNAGSGDVCARADGHGHALPHGWRHE